MALRAMMRAVTSATRGFIPEARGMEDGLTIAIGTLRWLQADVV